VVASPVGDSDGVALVVAVDDGDGDDEGEAVLVSDAVPEALVVRESDAEPVSEMDAPGVAEEEGQKDSDAVAAPDSDALALALGEDDPEGVPDEHGVAERELDEVSVPIAEPDAVTDGLAVALAVPSAERVDVTLTPPGVGVAVTPPNGYTSMLSTSGPSVLGFAPGGMSPGSAAIAARVAVKLDRTAP